MAAVSNWKLAAPAAELQSPSLLYTRSLGCYSLRSTNPSFTTLSNQGGGGASVANRVRKPAEGPASPLQPGKPISRGAVTSPGSGAC